MGKGTELFSSFLETTVTLNPLSTRSNKICFPRKPVAPSKATFLPSINQILERYSLRLGRDASRLLIPATLIGQSMPDLIGAIPVSKFEL